MKSRYLLAALLAMAVFSAGAFAQQRVTLPITNKEWETPFPGFKIVGNMYYVGTYDLGCYLIDTGAGLILINSEIISADVVHVANNLESWKRRLPYFVGDRQCH